MSLASRHSASASRQVANKSALPVATHDDDDGDKETDYDIGFDAFFEAERPGLVASGFPDDDEVLMEEARARYKYIVSKSKSPAKSPAKPTAAAVDKPTKAYR